METTTQPSLRDLLITPIERTLAEVELPEVGGGITVYLQSLTAKEFADFQRRLFGRNMTGEIHPDNMQKARLYLLCLSLVDADGQQILSDTDAKLLERQDAGLVKRLCDLAMEVSGFNASVEEDAGN